MECFEEETGKLLALREQEIAMLSEDLGRAQERSRQQEIVIAQQVDEISTLKRMIDPEGAKIKQ